VKLIKENIPFTMVANEVLYNKNLSFKAKGLYSYLFSKPDTWDFSGDRITMETIDGRKAIFSALKELEKAGFLSRDRLPNGKMEYNLKFSSKSLMPKKGNGIEEPNAQNGYVPKRLSGETGSISNTEEKVINKESNTTEQSSGEIPLLIKSFETINPDCKNFYGRPPQRLACQFLIDTYGFERVKTVIEKTLPKTNTIKFFPTITTPIQLKEKWASLESSIHKYQAQKLSEIKTKKQWI
jgi:hypothetical protein